MKSKLLTSIALVAGFAAPALCQSAPYDQEWYSGFHPGAYPAGLDNTYHPKQRIYDLGMGHKPASMFNMGNIQVKVNSADAGWAYILVYTFDGQYAGYYKQPILQKYSEYGPANWNGECPGFDADNNTIIIGTPNGWGMLRKGWGAVQEIYNDRAAAYINGTTPAPAFVWHPLFPASYSELCFDGLDRVVYGNFGNGYNVAYARPKWGGWFFIGPAGKVYYAGDTNDMGVDSSNRVWTLDYNHDGKTDIAYTRAGWGGYMLMLSNPWGYAKQYVPYQNTPSGTGGTGAGGTTDGETGPGEIIKTENVLPF